MSNCQTFLFCHFGCLLLSQLDTATPFLFLFFVAFKFKFFWHSLSMSPFVTCTCELLFWYYGVLGYILWQIDLKIEEFTSNIVNIFWMSDFYWSLIFNIDRKSYACNFRSQNTQVGLDVSIIKLFNQPLLQLVLLKIWLKL